MPRTETVESYTLEELETAHPEGYARVLRDWQDDARASDYTPWADEVMASLKAVVGAYGATLTDWSIGPWSPSDLSVSVEDDETGRECADYDECEGCPDCEDRPKDADWLLANVLRPLGYADKDGNADFPGLCKFTGYCADDDFMESVYRSVESGETLSDALRGLADVARRMMEDDCEQAASEESMRANWGDARFLADGTRWR